MKAACHAIFTSLATGTLVLAFVLLTYRFWFRPRRPVLLAAWNASDAVALYSAVFGLLMLLVAFLSGLPLRPLEAHLNSPITMNKILLAVMSGVAWLAFLLVRIRSGPGLWDRSCLASHFAYVAALAGFLWLISTNSIGGDLVGIPSGYEK